MFVHLNHLLFSDSKSIPDIVANYPDLEPALGTDSWTFNLLLLLSGYSAGQSFFKKMGIPEDVSKAAFTDVAYWCTHFKKSLSVTGISPRILEWNRELLFGSLYRLGRLQFNIRPFSGALYAFRSCKTGNITALIEKNINLDKEGQYNGINGIYSQKENWVSTLIRSKGEITGNPVSPLGFVKKELITLDLDEWKEVLAPGDPILDIHIPAGDSMKVKDCSESFLYAVEFFNTYFPQKTFKGWACHSWFLDNQYQQLLPSTSNIINFQKALYLYPINEDGDESLRRIFGENGLANGLDHAPQNNSMQKAVASFLKQGGHLRSGGGFFLKENLPFGEPKYQI